MRFLDGPATEKAVREMLRRRRPLRVAVPYWGAGAVERLGLENHESADIEVVCCLASVACDPAEVAALQRVPGKSRVLTHDRLHAKVWLTDDEAIVGSSNASNNGYGIDGLPQAGLLEANVSLTDRRTIKAISDWWDKLVDRSRKISPNDLREAERRRIKYWSRRPPPAGQSVYDLLKADYTSFEGYHFFVWTYVDDWMDDWAKAALADQKAERKNSKITCWQDAVAPAGSYIVDFPLAASGRPSAPKLYKVLDDEPLIKERRGTILLCRKVTSFEGLPLGGPKEAWLAAARRAAKSGEDSDYEAKINDFARAFLCST